MTMIIGLILVALGALLIYFYILNKESKKTITAVAPTRSSAIIASNISSGIEPYHAGDYGTRFPNSSSAAIKLAAAKRQALIDYDGYSMREAMDIARRKKTESYSARTASDDNYASNLLLMATLADDNSSHQTTTHETTHLGGGDFGGGGSSGSWESTPSTSHSSYDSSSHSSYDSSSHSSSSSYDHSSSYDSGSSYDSSSSYDSGSSSWSD